MFAYLELARKGWIWLGNFGAGLFSGVIWFLLWEWHWAYLMDKNHWDMGSAPNGLFIFHMVIGIVGGPIIGRLVYNFYKKGMQRVEDRKVRWL